MKHLHNRINGEELKKKLMESDEKRITLSFYKYAKIKNVSFFRNHFYKVLFEVGVLGRIYVAEEGINGQISVPEANINQFKQAMYDISFLENIRLNVAIEDDGKSFFKLAIKVKPKIVADGLNDDSFDPTNKGIHLDAEAFNQITAEEETILIDMRNHYESEVGHFENAITPDVETFRESLPIIKDMLQNKKDKKIVMYCTGGIRCEKASAYLKHEGFEEVYQLNGGIIEYTRQIQEKGLPNKFKGKNFVFDDRLGERISEEIISKCHQCGNPSDDHTNCANDQCHILFIQCKSCSENFEGCCSSKCRDFNALAEQEKDKLKGTISFNGTKFGKGRYKAHRATESGNLEGSKT